MSDRPSNESSAEYRGSGGSRLWTILLPITLVVAIAAAALSGWLLVRVAKQGTPSQPNYTGEQRADAKQKICGAMDLVRKGVSLNTNLLEPATPPELGDAVKKFANLLLDIGAAATAGAQNSQPDQAARLKDADAANGTIMQLCK
jgi:hypothetical protein